MPGMYQLPSFTTEHLDSSSIQSLSLIGNIHRRRWRWNPFDQELDMVQVSSTCWQVSVPVAGIHAPDVSGYYSIRVVVNHNPRNQLKFNVFESDIEDGLLWPLEQSKDGSGLHNINFRSKVSQVILFQVDTQDMTLRLSLIHI